RRLPGPERGRHQAAAEQQRPRVPACAVGAEERSNHRRLDSRIVVDLSVRRRSSGALPGSSKDSGTARDETVGGEKGRRGEGAWGGPGPRRGRPGDENATGGPPQRTARRAGCAPAT